MSHAPRWILAALFAAVLALPAAAQTAPGADARLAATEAAYGAAKWPKPAPARHGIAPATIEAPGWSADEVRYDPRRAEARVRFAPASEPGAEPRAPQAALRLRLFPSAAAARKQLLLDLAGCQARLEPLAGPGDVTFADAAAAPALVHGVFGNVGFTLRALEPGASLEPLALALGEALRAAAPQDAPAEPAPRIVRVDVASPAPPGAPTRITIDLDPAAPAPAALAAYCSAGASALAVEGGFELYPAAPGPVTVEVLACGPDLRVTRQRVELVVPAE